MFGRRSLFGILSCFGFALAALAAIPPAPVLHLLDHGFAAMASPAAEPAGLRALVLFSSSAAVMHVAGLASPERSGLSVVLASLNGPGLAPPAALRLALRVG